MIEINGKPILEHNLDMCRKAGVNDIYINLHHLPDEIRNYFGNGSNYGVNIKYNFEPDLLGTAGALLPFKNNLKDFRICQTKMNSIITIKMENLKK